MRAPSAVVTRTRSRERGVGKVPSCVVGLAFCAILYRKRASRSYPCHHHHHDGPDGVHAFTAALRARIRRVIIVVAAVICGGGSRKRFSKRFETKLTMVVVNIDKQDEGRLMGRELTSSADQK